MAIEYMGLQDIQGPLAIIDGVRGASYDEIVTMTLDSGEKRFGRVTEILGDRAVIQVFEGTSGLSLTNTKTKFSGEPMRIPLSIEMLGRTLDGAGRPIDGLGDYIADEMRDVNGCRNKSGIESLSEQLYTNGNFFYRLSFNADTRTKASYFFGRRYAA